MEKEGLSAKEMDNILNKKSGKLGLSGISADDRDIEKEILNGKTTTHTALVMSLIYDSEIYQVLNGKTDWAIHIVGKDLETGGELMNINFPEEGYHISIENWDNM